MEWEWILMNQILIVLVKTAQLLLVFTLARLWTDTINLTDWEWVSEWLRDTF